MRGPTGSQRITNASAYSPKLVVSAFFPTAMELARVTNSAYLWPSIPRLRGFLGPRAILPRDSAAARSPPGDPPRPTLGAWGSTGGERALSQRRPWSSRAAAPQGAAIARLGPGNAGATAPQPLPRGNARSPGCGSSLEDAEGRGRGPGRFTKVIGLSVHRSHGRANHRAQGAEESPRAFPVAVQLSEVCFLISSISCSGGAGGAMVLAAAG